MLLAFTGHQSERGAEFGVQRLREYRATSRAGDVPRLRLASAARTNAPLRVPTSSRTPLIGPSSPLPQYLRRTADSSIDGYWAPAL